MGIVCDAAAIFLGIATLFYTLFLLNIIIIVHNIVQNVRTILDYRFDGILHVIVEAGTYFHCLFGLIGSNRFVIQQHNMQVF